MALLDAGCDNGILDSLTSWPCGTRGLQTAVEVQACVQRVRTWQDDDLHVDVGIRTLYCLFPIVPFVSKVCDNAA